MNPHDPLANHRDLLGRCDDAALRDARNIMDRCRVTIADGKALAQRIRQAHSADPAALVADVPHVSA